MSTCTNLRSFVARQGFEPCFSDSESGVLPNRRAGNKMNGWGSWTRTSNVLSTAVSKTADLPLVNSPVF